MDREVDTSTGGGAPIRHWVEGLVGRILKSKREPIIVAAAITTSGPPHLGTVCEFMYPWAIIRELARRNVETYYVFIGDIMDAFDSIPAEMEKYRRQLEPHLGKPLADVPDPLGCHASYGEHYLAETEKLMHTLQVYPNEIIPATRLYEEGWYDDYLVFFTENYERVKSILEEVSMRKLPRDWRNYVLPVCEACGKIATTTVTEVDLESEEIRYRCDRKLEYASGCGHEGSVSVGSHRWKLMWRLDWPSRQDFLGVDVEGGGVDHFTQGGSWDTAVAVHTKLFNKEPPVGYKFGFVLLRGRKMSKSKGVGDIKTITDLIPPELMKYFLFKHELEENKNFDVSPEFLLRLYEDYRMAADKYEEKGLDVERSMWKKVYAYTLTVDDGRPWRVSFPDLLVYYQIYRDWSVVAEKLGDKEGVKHLAPYVENWIEKGMIPETYKIEYSPQRPRDLEPVVREFFERLEPGMSDLDIHNLVYEVARGRGVEPRRMFKALYQTLLGKDNGPRIGRLIVALGVERVKRDVLSRLEG